MYELSKLLHFLYFLTVVTYCLLIVCFACWGVTDFSKFSSKYNLLKKNWSQEVILDIVLTTEDDCPSGTGYLYDYVWPGTKTGCNCKRISAYMSVKFNVERKITENYCNKNQTLAGCINIHAIPKVPLRKWYENKTLCARRLSGVTFLNIASDTNTLPQFTPTGHPIKTCAENYTLCGSAPWELCIPGPVCPITDMIVANESVATEFSESLPFRFNDKANSSLQIYISRKSPRKLPLVEFRLSESEICDNKEEEGLVPSKTEYILRREKREPCDGVDDRFKLLDYINENDLFVENRLNFVATFLPDFELNRNENYGIYTRNYIPLEPECHKFIEILVNYGVHLNSLEKSQIGLYFVSLVCAILVITTLIIFEISIFLKPDADSFPLFMKFLKFTFFLSRFFVFPFAIWALSEALNSKEQFSFINNKKCSDDQTNNLIGGIYYQINDKSLFNDTLLLGVIAAMALIDLTIVTVKYCLKRVRSREGPLAANLLEMNTGKSKGNG